VTIFAFRSRAASNHHRGNTPGAWRFRAAAVIAGLVMSSFAAAATKLYDAEYDIISAALNHGIGAEASLVIIDGRTTGAVINIEDPGMNREDIARELGTSAAAIADWLRTNRRQYTLQAQLSLRTQFELLAQTRREAIFNQSDPATNWEQFHTQFPDTDGIVRVSRPGIDDIGRAALLYLEFECGYECGSGRLIGLQRDAADAWQVTSGTLVWITSPEPSP